jgi:AcrR family transcriptional regulator
MSSAEIGSLPERRNDLTRRLILDAAVDLLESDGVGEITMRAVARRANISQRTVFRYFATRDLFLDAIAEQARTRMALPPDPRSLDELLQFPRRFYEALERQQRLVIAGLHSEIIDRMREAAARSRWVAVRKIVDELAPTAPARERKIAATNISYPLGASSWRYYRFYFRLSLEETILCAETSIGLAIQSLSRNA